MSGIRGTGTLKKYTFLCLVLLYMIGGVCALTTNSYSTIEPSLYFNFNEGSGNHAFDLSGNGNAGTMYGVSRIENGACGRAISFNGINNYVEIPYSSQNHPQKEITVSFWFYTDSFEPQVLISTYENGGYRLAFDDGNDLWWTINLEGTEVSIPVQHESISLRQWHQVTATYDGQTSKVYLDGVLRNLRNASGPIYYEFNNYLILGADAGSYNFPDQVCAQYFRGGLDEVRIYPIALTYGQVIDERFRCSQEPAVPSSEDFLVPPPSVTTCTPSSGSVAIGVNDAASRTLYFKNQNETGIWNVTLPPGSTLIVTGKDLYSKSYPDSWYIEIADETGRITRTIIFPNTNNAPLKGVIPSGNATVYVKYFDGIGKFPATFSIRFESVSPPPTPSPPPTILNYPIIVIYSASWATLIAIILVIVWLHRRKQEREKKTSGENGKEEEKITE